MRLFTDLSWLPVALQVSLVSSQALIYISDASPPRSDKAPPSISPLTARLLLAQRLGLSQYESLEDADDSALDVLNTYGACQAPVFQQEEQRSGAGKLLLVVDGISDPEEIVGSATDTAISIDEAPTSSQNKELLSHFLQNLQSDPSSIKSDYLSVKSTNIYGGIGISRAQPEIWEPVDSTLTSKKLNVSHVMTLYKANVFAGHEHTAILHDTTLQNLTPKDGDRYTTAISDLKTFINHLLEHPSRISSTIILMPSTSNPVKRSATSPYGTFTHSLSPRQQQPAAEEPLSSPRPSSNKPSPPEIHPLEATTSPLPHGVLPTCHSSLESAISATNNCSGHGTAYKKSGGEKDCYACRCSKTVMDVGDGGTKTIYWGGAACQKKDISVPFFLLAGLSILLVGVVTWGVGLLVSVGSEELPSVIGAGVAGPRATK
ncbi:hypothetical protein ACLMJK_006936 [Lecanora helva]